ncbi:MAG: dockerin type 1 [Clostridiales bacterium]|jgi:hypothetical protein|nr:dockerin type 1 [Clostridiales bacterium]
MKKKFTPSRIAAVLLCLAFLTSCGANSAQKKADTEAVTDNSEGANASLVTMDMVTYEEDDYYTDWKNENPNYIELNGTSASINGSGAEVKENKITITKAGVYVISGKLKEGQIIVDVQDKGMVKLVLNGVEINCFDSAPVYVKNAGKTIISLEAGTQNIITDGENYVFSDATRDEPSGAIFSKANLTINGSGTLTVNGNYKDGIVSKDDLKITGGNINVYATDDGLMGRDMALVKEANITIEAEGDGIKSTNDTDATKGFIAVEGGTFKITSGADGIQAETAVLVAGGDFTISTGGGSINSSDKTENNNGPWGKGNSNTNTSTSTQTSETETNSTKAIKSASEILITGGTFNIDSSDDAIHSNNSVNITGGEFSIASGDDGIHGDSTITIKDGKINISKSYEGIESAVVSVSGGEIHVVAKDDGINVAGGNDGSSMNGRPGQNGFATSGDNKLNISGGYIVVNATGDGLDANGSIYMTSGTVVVSGPTSSGNGTLDYDGVFQMSGGLIAAAGSSGMAQAPSEESTQYSIIMNYSSTQQAGTLAALKDSNGSTVVAFKPEKEYQSLVISAPELKKGGTYTLYTGGTSTGALSDRLYTGGSYEGGTKVVEFTISTSVTWLSESGVTEAGSSGPGGGNKPGFGGGPGKGK